MRGRDKERFLNSRTNLSSLIPICHPSDSLASQSYLFSLRLIFHFSLRSVEICSILVSTSRQRAGEPSRSSISREMILTFSDGLRVCKGCVSSVERIW